MEVGGAYPVLSSVFGFCNDLFNVMIPIFLPGLLGGVGLPRVGNFVIYPSCPSANRGGSEMVLLCHFSTVTDLLCCGQAMLV